MNVQCGPAQTEKLKQDCACRVRPWDLALKALSAGRNLGVAGFRMCRLWSLGFRVWGLNCWDAEYGASACHVKILPTFEFLGEIGGAALRSLNFS